MSLEEKSAGQTSLGKVYLVGAGPGDPGLLTLRGKECLAQADLVLYDGLVNPLLLRYSHAQAQRTNRDGRAGQRVLDQSEINRQLVEAARQGLTVVRLKGGDPFIFGRGTEEVAALVAEGIPFEVVPGITAATAAAVYSGLSLTHRELASAVAFVTGHEDPSKPDLALDYEALARFPGTLVFYMGLHRLPTICERLMREGKPQDTPAALVSRATTPFQRTIQGTLATLPELVSAAQVHAPSLVIVGECVRLRTIASWFEDRPLSGCRIAITRPEEQADSAIDLALRLGAQPILLPTITISPPDDWGPVDDAIARLSGYDLLIFTSVNGVSGFLNRLWYLGYDARQVGRCRLAAIGPSTAAALATRSLRCDVQPAEYRAEALAAALAPQIAGQRVLWIRGSRGRDVLPRELAAAGAQCDSVVVYRNDDVTAWPPDAVKALEDGSVDWLALSSPTIARNAAQLLPPAARAHLGRGLRIAAISPVTADAAMSAGLPVTTVASEFTWDGLFQAMIEWEASRRVR